jgi:hypothetical protein
VSAKNDRPVRPAADARPAEWFGQPETGPADSTAGSHALADADPVADLKEIGAVLRRQAGRIAELEAELERARAAAEAARALALREATRRLEVQTELHAVRRTRLWRYSAGPRRVYRRVRLRLLRRRGDPDTAA